MAATPNCPECKTPLISSGAPHCANRTTPCGWVDCGKCGATVCTRSGRHSARWPPPRRT